VRIQTVDPSAFEMPDVPRQTKPGFFLFSRGGLQEVRFTKRTLRGGRRSDASSLNEASEKSLELRVLVAGFFAFGYGGTNSPP